MKRLIFFLVAVQTAGGSCAPVTGSSRFLPTIATALSAGRCRVVEGGVPVRWFSPEDPAELGRLAPWCDEIGPVVLMPEPDSRSTGGPDDLAIVSWNLHAGAGRLDELVKDLRAGAFSSSGRPPAHLVILLQEATRGDTSVASGDIVALAARLGLSLFYAPAIPNGAADDTGPRDRGNAILASLPLSDPVAIELPVERQRRLAIAATITGLDADGAPWRVRVATAHLENRSGVQKLFGVAARERQGRALVAALEGETPTVLGTDLNTFFGPGEPVRRIVARAFPATPAVPRVTTFASTLVLDYLFFKLPNGWQGSYLRAPGRYGSDHHPLVGRILRAPDYEVAGSR